MNLWDEAKITLRFRGREACTHQGTPADQRVLENVKEISLGYFINCL